MIPKATPTESDTPKATTTDRNETIVVMPANRSNAGAQAGADQDAGDSPGDADQHGFAQELEENVFLGGAHGAAHPDLADTLQHRSEHDVHDADATDDERDRRNRARAPR